MPWLNKKQKYYKVMRNYPAGSFWPNSLFDSAF